jgi:hypothetical protein
MRRVIDELEPEAVCEQPPKLMGRLLGAMLSPRSQKGIAKPAAAKPAAKAGAEA